MVHDKGRLDEVLLGELLEEEGEDVPLLVALLKLDVVLLRCGAGLLEGLNPVEIDAGVLLDRVDHRDPLERLAEIHLDPVVGDGGGAEHLLRDVAVEVLGQVHHPVVVGVGLVELHQGEFRVVAGVEALVAENAADLVDLFQAADNEALEVELNRDAELQVLVEGVEVGLKGPGRRAAGVGNQHGGLDLEEALAVQIAADAADDFGAVDEGFAHVLVHDEVDVPLPVAHVGVGQAVELLGKGLQALGEEGHLGGMDGDLAGFGAEDLAADPDNVADVELLELLIGLLAEAVAGDIGLDGPFEILHMTEGRLAHDPFGHQAAGNADSSAFKLVEIVLDLPAVAGDVIFDDRKGVLACLLQGRQLFHPDAGLFAQILSGSLLGKVSFFVHLHASFLSFTS